MANPMAEQSIIRDTALPQDHYKEWIKRTPFFSRVKELNLINHWSQWKAYTTNYILECASTEYFAARNSCSVFDLTPMSKYRIRGKDAEAFLQRLVTRDVRKIKPRRVGYSVWCNDRGKVIDDGTIFHLHEGDYRICSQERQYDWLMLSSIGFDVEISDETDIIGALAVQGPTSCAVLQEAGFEGIETMKPFGLGYFELNGIEVMISRTGYSGDLGYEVWVGGDNRGELVKNAEYVWDAIFGVKDKYGVRAIGSAALDMIRIEAGFVLGERDFMPALHTVRRDHDRSPFELDLDWLVDFSKGNFTGRQALLEEKKKGSKFRLVKLVIDGNKPAKDAYIFVGKDGKKVGTVTSAMWSPSCKANIALASLDLPLGHKDDDLWVEIYYQRELRWARAWAKATVQKEPFWNPPRKRLTPPAPY